jgi:pimeloyl-ACP methyl ester carboxylesterase
VAVQLAEKVQETICGMILENTFTSISAMADDIFPDLRLFKRLILRMFWPSDKRIANVRTPILFIVGTHDEIVPFHHTKKLHDCANNAVFKQYHQVEGGTHNDTWLKGGKDYIYALKDFIEKCKENKL